MRENALHLLVSGMRYTDEKRHKYIAWFVMIKVEPFSEIALTRERSFVINLLKCLNKAPEFRFRLHLLNRNQILVFIEDCHCMNDSGRRSGSSFTTDRAHNIEKDFLDLARLSETREWFNKAK